MLRLGKPSKDLTHVDYKPSMFAFTTEEQKATLRKHVMNRDEPILLFSHLFFFLAILFFLAYYVVLSSINLLKSIQFFMLVLWYDYSIVLYVYVSGMYNAVVLCIRMCTYVSVLPLLCLNVIQEVQVVNLIIGNNK